MSSRVHEGIGRRILTPSRQTSKSCGKYARDFFLSMHAQNIQGRQKHRFNGRNPFHATKCNLHSLKTVNAMHIKARPNRSKKKCKSKQTQKVLTSPKSPRQQASVLGSITMKLIYGVVYLASIFFKKTLGGL